ncbi:response regulator [Methylibium petroleiphilum]|uniref:response regulator n=1 Tax=Methylibium petroleiphilum TaxID=105560 RepID=UPI003D2704C8
MRILIVEDDRLLGDGLAAGLRSLGFAVDWFTDGAQADAALSHTPYDAIVLDLGLPGRDGLAWLARWRGPGPLQSTPVLVLTARDGIDHRIAGLDTGADDYLIKPIETTELAARLRAVLRRSQGRPQPLWQHGALSYQPAAKAAHWRGKPVVLTATECALLELLLANPHRVLPKPLILDKLYSFDQDIESNTVEVHVHHLRRKIAPKLVRTVRGVGYALGAPEELE